MTKRRSHEDMKEIKTRREASSNYGNA